MLEQIFEYLKTANTNDTDAILRNACYRLIELDAQNAVATLEDLMDTAVDAVD